MCRYYKQCGHEYCPMDDEDAMSSCEDYEPKESAHTDEAK